MAHKVFAIFLVFTTLTAVLAVGIHGLGYYLTSIQERPLRTDYVRMKPSGSYSHGLGILGASMLVIGVSTYSTRKRVRSLWNFGKLSQWLAFHIFLCLLGPTLVVFHTTFKAGGGSEAVASPGGSRVVAVGSQAGVDVAEAPTGAVIDAA